MSIRRCGSFVSIGLVALTVPLTSALMACGDDDDSGMTGADAGSRDATVVDAPVSDGGASHDASIPDAGAPADAPMCARPSCDPVTGICAQTTQTCVLGGREPACEPKAEVGDGEIGDECTGVLDCAPGLACFMQLSVGVCAQICCPGDDSCPDGMQCAGSGALIDGTMTSWAQCVGSRACDVLDPDGACEANEGCYIMSSMGETDCRRAGQGEAGEPCTEQSDCARGFFCGGITMPRTCQRICGLGEEPMVECPSEEGTCVAYSYSPEGSGICTPQ